MIQSFGWFGGKAWLVPTLLEWTPPHTVSVEAFGGAAWYTLNKPKSHAEVVNDVNDLLVNLWETIRTDVKGFKERNQYVIDARKLYYDYEKEYKEDKWAKCDAVEKAFRFYYMITHSFSFMLHGYHAVRFDWASSQQASYLNKVEALDTIYERIKEVHFRNEDVFDMLPRYDKPDVFMYLDPPYVQGGYAYGEFIGGKPWTDQDAMKLREMIHGFKNAKVLLSVDNGEFYVKEGWKMMVMDKGGRITKAGATPNRECLVANYEKPARPFWASTAAETTGDF
jgi:DNA adenine methylase